MEPGRSKSSIQEEARQNRTGLTKVLAGSAAYFAAVLGLCYSCSHLADSTLPAEIRQPADKELIHSQINYSKSNHNSEVEPASLRQPNQ